MRGEAVTLENIGKTVSETTATNNSNNNNGCLQSTLKFGLGCLGCLIGLPLLFALFIIIIVLIALIFGFSSALFFPLNLFGFDWNGMTTTHPAAGVIALILVLGIPLFSIVYALFSSNKKVKPLSRTFKWSAFIIWIIALIIFIFSGIKLNQEFHKGGWNINILDNIENTVSGSGIIADRTEDLPAFSQLKIDDSLIATVRIRKGNAYQISINGDDNIINNINWELENDVLKLGITDHLNFRKKSNLIIVITTPKITGIKMGSLGQVSIDNKMVSPDFKIEVAGAGTFQADSLYVQNLTCNLGGIGQVTLGGKANQAFIKLEGAGKIDSYNLAVDSLTAQLKGVGSIKSNPVTFLDASLDGVGSITYKEEPKFKQTNTNGVGRIRKE